MDAKEMEQLLREGAYAVLLEDDTDIIKEFYEQDIDDLLKQRSHVLITEAGAQTESWLNKRKKAGRTSKSMFTGESSKEHAEIDVNDPDFWKKVLPDLVTPDIMLERLSDDSLIDEEDEQNREAIEKYMKDLAQMMEGMLDLSRRNQLPERERGLCLKLLLRITLKDEVFDDFERDQAQEWLSVIEGTRSRRNRTELYNIADNQQGGRGGRGGRGRGRGRGGRGGRGSGAAAAGDSSAPGSEGPKRRGGRWGNRYGRGVRGEGDSGDEQGNGGRNAVSDEEAEPISSDDDEFGTSSSKKKTTKKATSTPKSGGGRGGAGRGRGGRGRGGRGAAALAASAAAPDSTSDKASASGRKRQRKSQYFSESDGIMEEDSDHSQTGIQEDSPPRSTVKSTVRSGGPGRGTGGRSTGRGKGRDAGRGRGPVAVRPVPSDEEEEDEGESLGGGLLEDDDASLNSADVADMVMGDDDDDVEEAVPVRGRGGRVRTISPILFYI